MTALTGTRPWRVTCKLSKIIQYSAPARTFTPDLLIHSARRKDHESPPRSTNLMTFAKAQASNTLLMNINLDINRNFIVSLPDDQLCNDMRRRHASDKLSTAKLQDRVIDSLPTHKAFLYPTMTDNSSTVEPPMGEELSTGTLVTDMQDELDPGINATSEATKRIACGICLEAHDPACDAKRCWICNSESKAFEGEFNSVLVSTDCLQCDITSLDAPTKQSNGQDWVCSCTRDLDEPNCKVCDNTNTYQSRACNLSKDLISYVENVGSISSIKCERSDEVIESVECFDSASLLGCVQCEDCQASDYCVFCENCKSCTSCIHCENCEDCKRCVKCIDCEDCEDCVDCIGCTWCYRRSWSGATSDPGR